VAACLTVWAVYSIVSGKVGRGRQPTPGLATIAQPKELVGCPVALLSTSPERDDTILVHNPFEH